MRPQDNNINYVLHNSYLRPLLDKHSKNESITYEDLIHSWDQVVHQREKILLSSEFVTAQNNQDKEGSMMELDSTFDSSTSADMNQLVNVNINDKKEELKDKDHSVRICTITTITSAMKEIEQMHQNLLTCYNNAAQQYYENILNKITLPPPNPPSEKQIDYLSRCINQIQNDLHHDNLYHNYSWRVDNAMKDEWLWIPIKRKISEYYGEKFNQKLELLKERKAAATAAVVAAASNASLSITTQITDNIHGSDMEQPKTESHATSKPTTTINTSTAHNNSLVTENPDPNNIAMTSIPSSTDTVLPTGSTKSLPSSSSSNQQPQKTFNNTTTNTEEEGIKVDATLATATAAITTNTNNDTTCDPLDSEKHLTEDEDGEEFYEDDEYSDDGEIDEINEEEEELQQEISDGEEVDDSNVVVVAAAAAAGSSHSSGNPKPLEHGDAKPKPKIIKRTITATTTTTITPQHERTTSDPSLHTPRRGKLNTTQSQQSTTGSRSTTNKRKVRESVGSSSTVGERGGGGRSGSGRKAARTGRGRGRGGRGGRSRGTN